MKQEKEFIDAFRSSNRSIFLIKPDGLAFVVKCGLTLR